MIVLHRQVDDRGLVVCMISQPMHGVDDLDPIERYTTSKVDDLGLKRDDEHH